MKAYEKIAGSGQKTKAFQSGGTLDNRMGNMFGKAAKVHLLSPHRMS
jgi:hypothetical protein